MPTRKDIKYSIENIEQEIALLTNNRLDYAKMSWLKYGNKYGYGYDDPMALEVYLIKRKLEFCEARLQSLKDRLRRPNVVYHMGLEITIND